jgi:hypothetical protein
MVYYLKNETKNHPFFGLRSEQISSNNHHKSASTHLITITIDTFARCKTGKTRYLIEKLIKHVYTAITMV